MELRFEFHLEGGQVDEVPPGEGPFSVLAVVGKADEEVDGVFPHFGGLGFGLEIKGAEGGCTAGFLEEFWVEVGDGFAGEVFDAEVGIPGSLFRSIRDGGDGAGEVGVGVNQGA